MKLKVDKNLIDLSKKLDGIEFEREVNGNRKQPTKEEQRAKDATRYQAMKKQYALHDESSYIHNNSNHTAYIGEHCTSGKCVIECPFWPKIGFLSDSGIVYYDDANLMVSFYGADNALETRGN